MTSTVYRSLVCHTHRRRERPAVQPSQCFVVADKKTSSYKQENEKEVTRVHLLQDQLQGQREGVVQCYLPPGREKFRRAVSVATVTDSRVCGGFRTSVPLDIPQYSYNIFCKCGTVPVFRILGIIMYSQINLSN